jgi:hypothetical protein
MLFAFGGGSILAFMKELNPEYRKTAAQAIFAFCSACLIGIYFSFAVSESLILNPKNREMAQKAQSQSRVIGKEMTEELTHLSITNCKYIRSFILNKVNAIDAKYKTGAVKAEQAYEQLFILIQTAIHKDRPNEEPGSHPNRTEPDSRARSRIGHK